MKKTAVIVLILMMCCLGGRTESAGDLPFRSLPGSTCFPLFTEGEGELEGHFILDCPMAWDGGDMSEVYGLPTVMALDPGNRDHLAVIAEISPEMREKILADRSHPISGFLTEGLQVIEGKSTPVSRVLETYDLDGLTAVKVEMTGQGFEMIWVSDPVGEDPGTLWFFMYPADPEDEEYSRIIEGMADSSRCFSQRASGKRRRRCSSIRSRTGKP
ncbi:MAG: hypothetical protein IJR97_02600 [Clostridia bacterium]|nr:hypothetical protein [Clostridia bacterium]